MEGTKRLTARAVRELTEPGRYGAGDGLYLDVASGGSKSWVFRFQLHGRRREMGVGSVRHFTLAEARDKAVDLRRAVARGLDPLDERRAIRASARAAAARAMTFLQCAEAYIAAHEDSWKNAKHRWQWGASLASFVYPHFGEVMVDRIDVAMVLKALEPIWRTKPETASRVRGRIETVLSWATAREYRQGENPARWRGHLQHMLPARNKVARVEHHAAMPYRDVGAFMAALADQNGVAARALEFTILTAARTGETIGARWSEFNMAERVWTVPAGRMKAGREHKVPLSHAALAVLTRMAETRESDFVFPGHRAGQALSNMAMLMLLRRMGHDSISVHGFRSSFSDWAAEQTAFPAEVREMALAHAVGDKVEAAYRRGALLQKRRQLADAWGRYCMTPTAPAGDVVPLQAATRRLT